MFKLNRPLCIRPPALALLCASLSLSAASAVAADKPERNLVISPGAAAPAITAQRVALVIGNGGYKEAPLSNPANDARAMAQVLKDNGFAVTLKVDTDIKGMLSSIRHFGDQLRKGGVGVFYYAGHGMQIKGRNYLIPVGSAIEREDEVAYQAVDAQAILDKMDAAGNGTNIMILDACRNNPFARSFRSAQQGLAQMDAPVGTLVAFATAPGAVASDGVGSNGLYTHHLLAALREPGIKVEDVFKRVRSSVRRDSKDKQVPWEATSLEGDFYFIPPVAPTVAADAALEQSMWALVKDSPHMLDLKAFLARFPKGAHAAEAQARLAKLSAELKPVAAVPTPTPVPVPAPAPVLANPAAPSAPPVAPAPVLAVAPPPKPAPAVTPAPAPVPVAATPAAAAPVAPPVSSPAKPPAKAEPDAATNPLGFRVGDRWSFQVVNKYKGEVISNLTRKITKVLPNGEMMSGQALLTPNGNLRQMSNARYASRVFTDAELMVPAKLEPGHRQDFSYHEDVKQTDGREYEQDFQGTLVVKAQEKVTVPAGEFTAYRIERDATIRGVQKNGRDTWQMRQQITAWYVPAIRSFVALDETLRSAQGGAPDLRRTELVSYELRGTTVATKP
ncbi:caspase family protein [Curvibacter sp. HBC61]|uniref:Caspase family protein n=1 Tax=Curvibacter cyanobacteriorum TaxID=3026422 RepID=A0ABT5MZW0_9BURK|nr:caspase family protein [Curvibacter sp. HBC61]MDD0839607.1 caspase family protein [Curvibacter sp. HBC61]